MKKKGAKTKQFQKIYKDIFKTIEELREDKITPREANKRATATRRKIKKL